MDSGLTPPPPPPPKERLRPTLQLKIKANSWNKGSAENSHELTSRRRFSFQLILVLHVLVYLFFTFIHKRSNATVTFFLKFMSNFLEIHILFTSYSCALTYGPLRLSCVFLANYMPDDSGTYGPILQHNYGGKS